MTDFAPLTVAESLKIFARYQFAANRVPEKSTQPA
jgi:hypothetical protein